VDEAPISGPLTLQAARQVLAAQPFSVLLGAEVTRFERGTATIEIAIRSELTQQNGYLHGGVLSYAADNALTFAGGSVLGPAVLTAGFTIKYLRPAQGSLLRAEATVTHAGQRRATCHAELRCTNDAAESALVATARGTIVAIGSPSAESSS
jgi:uncharacterized protein (TIGR00369 family)